MDKDPDQSDSLAKFVKETKVMCAEMRAWFQTLHAKLDRGERVSPEEMRVALRIREILKRSPTYTMLHTTPDGKTHVVTTWPGIEFSRRTTMN